MSTRTIQLIVTIEEVFAEALESAKQLAAILTPTEPAPQSPPPTHPA